MEKRINSSLSVKQHQLALLIYRIRTSIEKNKANGVHDAFYPDDHVMYTAVVIG